MIQTTRKLRLAADPLPYSPQERPGCIRPDLIADPAHPYEILENEYGKYSVPLDYMHRQIPQILAAGEVYEPKTLKLMAQLAGRGDIVSGGAFVGDFFPALSHALHPDAQLHTFEPNPMAYASALHTIALNNLTNVRISQVALDEISGLVPLQVTRDGKSPLAAAARVTKMAIPNKTIDVKAVPLDDLVPKSRRVSVLHLDIEGRELHALAGAHRLIHRCRPVIILEAAKASFQKAAIRFMRHNFPYHQYSVSTTMERNIVLVPSNQ